MQQKRHATATSREALFCSYKYTTPQRQEKRSPRRLQACVQAHVCASRRGCRRQAARSFGSRRSRSGGLRRGCHRSGLRHAPLSRLRRGLCHAAALHSRGRRCPASASRGKRRCISQRLPPTSLAGTPPTHGRAGAPRARGLSPCSARRARPPPPSRPRRPATVRACTRTAHMCTASLLSRGPRSAHKLAPRCAMPHARVQ